MVKIERYLVRKHSLSHQGKKIGQSKLIQCSIEVSFQGQRNPQKCKNPNKITSFKG